MVAHWLLLCASFFLVLVILTLMPAPRSTAAEPLKIAVIGLTHTHVHWILGRPNRGDIQIVGIVEPNRELAERYVKQHGLTSDLIFPSMEALVKSVELDAVTAFGSTLEHLQVVEFFAPRGIHVMVEKPLAVNFQQATKMAQLARQHKIHLLTNYETTWYATNHRAFEMLNVDKSLGELRKIVVHSGHQGPKEIGVNQEFLDWLTDPRQNGGGAVTDFGCYGVNLTNWLTGNQRPTKVTAVLQQLKPDIYPNVDDEATIIIEFPKSQAIVQASWNWPINRKDMEVYGSTGQVICHDRHRIEIRLSEKGEPATSELAERQSPNDDPFAYFAAVVNDQISPSPSDPSSLENNLLVVEILDAAIRSAREKRSVEFDSR